MCRFQALPTINIKPIRYAPRPQVKLKPMTDAYVCDKCRAIVFGELCMNCRNGQSTQDWCFDDRYVEPDISWFRKL